ncbi:MAG: DNA-protecting protein DprA [Alphaproteobacteria bacterium]|nr:DNA-protecting protein DprA [Alphaproteobacteria bacterium]
MTALRYPDLSTFDLVDCLRLIRSEHVGPITFFHLLERYKTPAHAIAVLPEIAARKGKPFTACTREDAEREISLTHKFGARLIRYGEAEYPAALLHLYDPPPVMTVLGRTELLRETEVLGIVGARNASTNGKHFARRMARSMGEKGFVIASGLARGIDTEAHIGSLESGTIAVTACGIDVVYPPENNSLYSSIAEKGVVIAEQPFGAQPHAKSFPKRNRLIAGLSRGVLVVEASLKSGSLITAQLALEQGREVFSVPGSPLDPRCRGTNDLIRQGATLTESEEDMLSVLRTMPRALREATPEEYTPLPATPVSEETLADARHTILENLSVSPVLVDELIAECQLTPHIVAGLLLELELTGHIERHPGNRVSQIMESA